MNRVLADEIAKRLKQAVDKHGRASIAVSGGTTPISLYDQLSDAAVPWEHVWIVPSDERWVPTDSEASNEHMIHTHLLKNRAARAHFVSLKSEDESLTEEALQDIEGGLEKVPLPFDVVILGMGSDMHTASLFPNAQGVDRALDLTNQAHVASVYAPGAEGSSSRITLTLSALLASRFIVLLIQGDKKATALRKALATESAMVAPISGILRQGSVQVEVFWAP